MNPFLDHNLKIFFVKRCDFQLLEYAHMKGLSRKHCKLFLPDRLFHTS